MRRIRRGVFLVFALLAAALAAPRYASPTRASAEEPGVVVKLSYTRGYSNAGPNDAYGTAHVWAAEGVCVLAVHNMPHFDDGRQYVSWIVNTTTGEALRLDAFNADAAGNASQDTIFNGPLPQGANAVVVTVRGPGDPVSLPTGQRTLAGFFAPRQPVSAPGSAGPAGARVGRTPAPTRTGQPGASHPTRSSGPVRSNSPVRAPIIVSLPKTGGGPAARARSRGPRQKSHGEPGRHR